MPDISKITVNDATYDIKDAEARSAIATKSTVSGTDDGTNWSTITIDGTTKNIPAGGSGSGTVTSVTAGTGLQTSDGQPITTSGTISMVSPIFYDSSASPTPLPLNADTLQSHNAAYFQSALTVNPASASTPLTSLGINGTNYTLAGGNVDDVVVNGTSIVDNKVASVNFKAINNEVITGIGNIEVQPAITSTTDLVSKTINAGLVYSTTAPTEANIDGLKFVVLTSEPATKYDGWFYIIIRS